MKTTPQDSGSLRPLRFCRLLEITTLLLTGFASALPAHALELLSAQTRGNPNGVTVTFSAPVSELTAANPANYAINNGVVVSNGVMIETTKVRLNTSLIAEGKVYTLTVNGVQDRTNPPNTIAPNTQTNFLQTQGGITRREFWNIRGDTVAELTNNARFPNVPDLIDYTTALETPVNARDLYGVQFLGFITAPVSGDYAFYLCSDDQSLLFLSSDEDPANKRAIATEPQWNSSRNWIGLERRQNRENISAPIPLLAGRKYYIEALMKDYGGGDNLAVAWKKPGDPEPANGDPPILGEFLSTLQSGPALLTRQPVSQAVGEAEAVTFAAGTAGTPPLGYQWFRNGHAIPGETNSMLTIWSAELADDQAIFTVAASNFFSTVTSSNAVLTVKADTAPPRVVAATGGLSLTNVVLKFSEPINATEATNLANYSINGGLALTGVSSRPDRTTVVLSTGPQTGGTEYRVTVNGIRDRSAAAHLIVPNSQAAFVGWLPEEFVGPFPSWVEAKRDFGAVGDGIADDTAALQAALNALGSLNYNENPKHPCVLYLRAGTYRITQTLKIVSRLGISILGEDPATTIIKWDGAANGLMLLADGVPLSKWGRLTWDGAGKANSAIDHSHIKGLYQVNANEHADEVFKDLAVGLRMNSPNGGDTHAILRCQFLRCSDAGISTESFNAVVELVWHCRFEDCRIGLDCKAGSFNVYESLFLRSTEEDIFVKDQFYGIRNNTSIGSKKFLVAGGADHESELTIAGNTILDTEDAISIHVQTQGPVHLLDNVIRSRVEVQNGPVVYVRDNLFSLGNQFTVDSPCLLDGRSLVLQDKTVPRSAIEDVLPELPGTLPNRSRTIIEVHVGANALEIQEAINRADLLRGQRPVVHLPAGSYGIDRTLVIPPGCDVQLVGDGYRSTTDLSWTGSGAGPVLHLQGPSRATLRNFQIHGHDRAHGILVDDCDQPGARVFLEQTQPTGSLQHSLLVDRLDHADISVHDFYHYNCETVSVKVSGGGPRARGQPADGRVVIFGGVGSNALDYDITNSGALLVKDMWNESNSKRFMVANGSGTFTLDTGKTQPNYTDSIRALEIENFRGQLTFLNMFITTRDGSRPAINSEIKGSSPDTSLLLMGLMGHGESYFTNSSSQAEVVLFNSVNKLPDGAVTPIADQGAPRPAFLLKMLAQTRNEKPRLIGPLPSVVTDVRLYRIFIERALIAIRLSGSNVPPVLASIADQTISEGSNLTETATATDADLPLDSLTFSLMTGAPEGATISPTGVLLWTPDESQGNDSYPISIRVTDNGSPPLSATNTFTVKVTEVNAPPVLAPIGNRSINESSALDFVVSASDPNDIPPNQLTLSVAGLPTGATFDAVTGAFAWTPSEAQGPGAYQVTFTVTDDGQPPLHASETVTIAVNEVNAPPIFTKGPDQTINQDAGPRTLANWATNISVGPPGDAGTTVTFLVSSDNAALFAAQPAISSTGALTYTPGTNANGVAHIAVMAKDDGGTAHGGVDTSAPQTCTITVNKIIPLRIENLEISLGDRSFTFHWTVREGRTYKVQYRASLIESEWQDLPVAPAINGSIISITDQLSTSREKYYRIVEMPWGQERGR